MSPGWVLLPSIYHRTAHLEGCGFMRVARHARHATHVGIISAVLCFSLRYGDMDLLATPFWMACCLACHVVKSFVMCLEV